MILFLIVWPLVASVLLKLVSLKLKRFREAFVVIACLAQLTIALTLAVKTAGGGHYALRLSNLCGMSASFATDGFRSIYAAMAAFMWFCASLMSKRYFAHYHNRTRYYFFFLLTLSGVTGMFLADDLFTAFIFFEIMSMASYPWVAHEETPSAMRAAATYLGVAVLGGMVTLMGMLLMHAETGSLAYEALRATRGSGKVYTAGALILFGFIAKAGAFPLHIWLPKAHPVAPAPASALLSGMLTKAGVLGIIVVSFNIFAGSFTYGCILLFIALITMLLGAVLGVFSVNLKRTLACSSMSQIGYILTGVASSVLLEHDGALPYGGAVGHMINHSALKLVLFMSAGCIYMNAHSLDLNVLRGYGRKKPLIHLSFLLGALGLSGVPLFNGYISKTMIHEGLVEAYAEYGLFIFKICEWVFLFAAGLTTAYMLKTYICLFLQKNSDAEIQKKYDSEGLKYLDAPTRLALVLSAALIPIFGIMYKRTLLKLVDLSLPFVKLTKLPEVEFFGAESLISGAVTLLIGALVYIFAVRKLMYSEKDGYIDLWSREFDLEDRLYRPLFCGLLPRILSAICSVLSSAGDLAAGVFAKALIYLSRALQSAGDAFASAFTFVLSLTSRLAENAADYTALIIKETAFTDHKRDVRREVYGAAGRIREKSKRFQNILGCLKPEIKPDPREVTDLRYGSYFTNTISFGLIIATVGIVAALIYIILKNR